MTDIDITLFIFQQFYIIMLFFTEDCCEIVIVAGLAYNSNWGTGKFVWNGDYCFFRKV